MEWDWSGAVTFHVSSFGVGEGLIVGMLRAGSCWHVAGARPTAGLPFIGGVCVPVGVLC